MMLLLWVEEAPNLCFAEAFVNSLLIHYALVNCGGFASMPHVQQMHFKSEYVSTVLQIQMTKYYFLVILMSHFPEAVVHCNIKEDAWFKHKFEDVCN